MSSLHVSRSGPLRGSCRVPGDKSISHRALLFGALCDGVVEASGLGQGGDNLSTAAALRALGVDVRIDGTEARIAGVGFSGLQAASAALDCGNSGTTIRLLLGLLAGRPFETEMCGDASLTRRPMGRVATPLRVRGGALAGITYQLKVASAQLKSAIILAALQARGASELREPARSRDHSERMLGFLGAPISTRADGAIVVDPTGWNGQLKAAHLTIPGDLSSATFLIIAALTVPGSDVTIENVGLNPTRAGALDVLRAMGADLTIEPTGDAMGEPVGRVRARASRLRGVRVAGELALRAIDEIPALAVAAARAEGQTVFADLAELRIKESDRIAALARELGRAGAAVTEQPDGFTVGGLGARPPTGGTVVPEHDHRIAMAGAILGLGAGDETAVPAADIATSFPTFAETLGNLGAPIALR